MTDLMGLITLLVSFILGFIAKKNKWISSKLIPIQNLLVGIIFAIVEWIITKDFSLAIAMSGLLAGGTYDIFKNLNELIIERKANKSE